MTKRKPEVKPKFPWTEPQLAQLKRWWEVEGVTSTRIAEMFGISRSAVMGKIDRLKLVKEPNSRRSTVNQAAEKQRLARVARMQLARANLAERKRNDELVEKIVKPVAVKPKKSDTPFLLEGSQPRPWMTRRYGECCFTVMNTGADAYYCCLPADDGRFCTGHAKIAYEPLRPRKVAA